jgi:hypothetical protein
MPKRKYRSKNFGAEALARIELCNEIIADYQGQGLRLTLRQLYYQLVTRNAITNAERSYKNLSSLVSDARLAGLVDWNAIEDRVRVPRQPPQWASISDLVEAATAQYRLNRWDHQTTYVELWVEKDALAGVLAPLAFNHHVTLMVNRGYSSQSAMYEAAQRFKQHQHRDCILFYLGDHDPSGEDMVRDIADRLAMFGVSVDVRKIALTMEQVQQYNPPPNPAKVTDPRAAAYIAEHGDESWEVDALPPQVLTQLINDAIEAEIDTDALQEILDKEESDREVLRAAVEGMEEN